ncbi:hypothetical protein Tco_0280998 [Tanacetum coccineum]
MGQMRFPSSVPDTELVLYPLQDKLTSRDKRLDLSVFKLSRLLFNLLSSGSSSYWRSYGLHESIGMTTLNLSPLLAHLHSLRTASLNVRVFVLRLPAEHPKGNSLSDYSLSDYSLSDLEMLKVIYTKGNIVFKS